MALVWISECYTQLGYRATAQRYAMLTLVEDGIHGLGAVTFGQGTYHRLVWTGLLSESEWRRYAQDAYKHYDSNRVQGLYPEWVLQELDRDWIAQLPAPQEAAFFFRKPTLRKALD